MVQKCADRERLKLVRTWTSSEFAVLSGGKQRYFRGCPVVAQPDRAVPAVSIVLAATAGVEYQLAMQSACRPNKLGHSGLIICSAGGRLAHLATVGRELCCTVLLMEGAVERLKAAQEVVIDLHHGRLHPAVFELGMVLETSRLMLARSDREFDR